MSHLLPERGFLGTVWALLLGDYTWREERVLARERFRQRARWIVPPVPVLPGGGSGLGALALVALLVAGVYAGRRPERATGAATRALAWLAALPIAWLGGRAGRGSQTEA